MKIDCLTSLVIDPDQPKDDKIGYYDSEKEKYFMLAKNVMLRNELENGGNYVYSQIHIGQKRDSLYFELYRNNIRLLSFAMRRNSIRAVPNKVEEAKKTENIELFLTDQVITIKEIMDYKFDITDYKILSIKIKFIKVFPLKIKPSYIQQIYTDYANRLEALVGNFNSEEDLREKQNVAFANLGKLTIPEESIKKFSNQKIIDLYDAIKRLCDSETGNIKNVPDDARYGGHLQEKVYIKFLKGKYDHRAEKTLDFSACLSLSYSSITPTWFNIRWFDATWMISLEFHNNTLFNNPTSWKTFVEQARKLLNLTILKLTKCSLNRVSDDLFKVLPKTFKCLILDNNNLKSIPKTIEVVENLKYLSLNGNESLDNSGIPWEKLPVFIKYIKVRNTKVTKLSKDIERLKKLKILNIDVLEDFPFFPEELQQLHIYEGSNIPINVPAKRLTSITMTNKNLTAFDESQASRRLTYLNLSNNNIEMFTFKRHFEHLTVLHLRNNGLTSIKWKRLPESLEDLDLSQNKLTKVRPIEHLTRLSVITLRHNEISKLTDQFNQLSFLYRLDLSDNHLTKLPNGFENIPYNGLHLNLSRNHFSESSNLRSDLWNRLPLTFQLKLNENFINELPCQLAGSTSELHAVGCNLTFVCPHVISAPTPDDGYINLNLAKNPDLKNLSYIPRTIFQPPYAKELVVLDTSKILNDETVLIMDNEDLKFTERFPTLDNKPVYDFSKVKETKIEKKTICKCCAMCDTKDKPEMTQQLMVMDFKLSVLKSGDLVDEDFTQANEKLFRHQAWLPGKWKTMIRTRLCDKCIEEIIEETDRAYDEYIYGINEDGEDLKVTKKTKKNNQKLSKGREAMDTGDIEAIRAEKLNDLTRGKLRKKVNTRDTRGMVNTTNLDTPELVPNNDTSRMHETEEVTCSLNPSIINNNSSVVTASSTLQDVLMSNTLTPLGTSENQLIPGFQQPSIPYEGPVWLTYPFSNPTVNFDLQWPYSYPTYDNLANICQRLQMPIYYYPFEGIEFVNTLCGKTTILVQKVEGDGNCGFRALSYLLTGSQENHGILRNYLRNQIIRHQMPKTFYTMFPDVVELSQNPNHTWMTDQDISAAAYFFRLNIMVFTNLGDLKWALYNDSLLDHTFEGIRFNYNLPSILLSNVSNFHYDAVLTAR